MQIRDTRSGTDRVVPLTPPALEVVRRQPRRAESHFVFTKTNGLGYKDLRGSFHGAVRRSGVKDLVWHDLRRTCGSWLLQDETIDMDMKRVSVWLGHKSIATTEKIYAHLDTKALHRGVTKSGTSAVARDAEIIELFA